MQKKSLLAAALIAGFAPSLAALDIAGSGSGLPILIPANPSPVENYAAEELDRYIFQVTGFDAEIIKSDDYTGNAIKITIHPVRSEPKIGFKNI